MGQALEGIGKVVEWNDDRGFGFIQMVEDAAERRVFFHIRDYRRAGRRPETGEIVHVRASRQADGRWRAETIERTAHRRPGATRRAVSGSGRSLPIVVVIAILCGYVALLAWSIQQQRIPAWVAPLVVALSAITWIAYWRDKRASQRGQRRTPESTLHLLELVGGWPGALVAQRTLHHKRSKALYLVMFWVMAALNTMAVVVWPEILG